MDSNTIDIIIVFWDGVKREIKEVTQYGHLKDHGVFDSFMGGLAK